MTPGRKDKKKKNKPKTPESSTPPSVTDETKELLSAASGGTSSHQPRGKKKQKSAASEPSTQSSEVSVVDDDATTDSQKEVAGSPHTGPGNSSTKNSPGSTRGKDSLAVPDQGSGGSRSPSKSPLKTLSPMKRFTKSLTAKLSPKKSQKPMKHEVRSEDSSSKSSSKSASSSSVTSHNSKKRQESNASNISSENSRSSNSKSSSISCGDNKEHLSPEMRQSGDAVENTNNGSQLSVDKRDEDWKLLVGSNLLAVPPYLSTNRMDNLLVEGELRPRSRSDSSDVFLQQREISLSKDDSKPQEEDSDDPDTQMGATAACSVQPVRNRSPRTGDSEIGVDIQGATASDQSVRMKDTSKHWGVNAPSSEGGSDPEQIRSIGAWRTVNAPSGERGLDQSVGTKNTATHMGANAPSGVCRSDQSVRKDTGAWSVDGPSGVDDRSDPSVRKKTTGAWRAVNVPSGEGGLDQSVGTKNTATHMGANAPSVEGRSDQSVGKKDTGAWSADGPSGVDDRSDKSVRSKDSAQRSGNDGKRVEKAKHSFLNSVTDLFAEIWQPRYRRLNQNDQAARPRLEVTRHRSLSPRCQHKFVHTPDCSATSRLNARMIRERRNQKKCKQPKHFNDNVDDIGNQRRAVRGNASSLDGVRRNLPSLENQMKLVISNLNLSRDEIVNSPSSLEEIDRYSSWLQEVRASLMELQETLNEIIENSNFSGLYDIRQNIKIHDENIDELLGGINPNRLPGSNSRRLAEELESLARLNVQLEEIRNNVDFTELKKVSKKLSDIHKEIVEKQKTVRLNSLLEVLHHLWHLWHMLQFILGR